MQDESNIVADKVAISKLISKKHEDNSLDFEVNTEKIKEMINSCNKRGVEVILIEMPVYKTYYDLLNSQKKQKINATLLSLERKNKGVRFYDFSQELNFVDEDLRDADHLTNQGAVKFSKLLNGIIEQ
jgi:poly-D-alanine transfer protein DltD